MPPALKSSVLLCMFQPVRSCISLITDTLGVVVFIFRSPGRIFGSSQMAQTPVLPLRPLFLRAARRCWKVYEVSVVIQIDAAMWSHCWHCCLLIPYDRTANPPQLNITFSIFMFRVLHARVIRVLVSAYCKEEQALQPALKRKIPLLKNPHL